MPAEELMLRLLPIGAAPARHLISEHRGQGPALSYGVTPV
jgi:hypothetical protein